MLKQIYKILWQQRRMNGWIFCELLIVTAVFWALIDLLIVDYRTYFSPLGYDITNTYRLKLAVLPPKSSEYVLPENNTLSQTEELQKLMEHIRLEPEVDAVCATYYSCPYSFGNSWMGIKPADGDTTLSAEQAFQVRRVTADYFQVFRVKDVKGNQLVPQANSGHPGIIISRDMEKAFYKNESGKGRRVKINSEEEIPIMDVCENIRPSDYEKSEPCFYEIMEGESLIMNVEYFGAASAELCVRMKQPKTPAEMNRFLEDMGDRLRINNLYVNGYISLNAQRNNIIRHAQNDTRTKVALMSFILINVFFGVIGTFWIRTQKRRSEVGLHIALGSTRPGIFRYMNTEGLMILLLTVPFILCFVGTFIYLDIPDSGRMAMSIGRVLLTLGITYLVLGCMICLGVSFPAWKAMKTSPAEALHYE